MPRAGASAVLHRTVCGWLPRRLQTATCGGGPSLQVWLRCGSTPECRQWAVDAELEAKPSPWGGNHHAHGAHLPATPGSKLALGASTSCPYSRLQTRDTPGRRCIPAARGSAAAMLQGPQVAGCHRSARAAGIHVFHELPHRQHLHCVCVCGWLGTGRFGGAGVGRIWVGLDRQCGSDKALLHPQAHPPARGSRWGGSCIQ